MNLLVHSSCPEHFHFRECHQRDYELDWVILISVIPVSLSILCDEQ